MTALLFNRISFTMAFHCHRDYGGEIVLVLCEKKNQHLFTGAHRHGQGGGHLPSPGKVEKCYRVKKTPSPEVSFNGRARRCFSVKTVNDCSSPTVSFLYLVKELCVVLVF